MSQSSPRVVLAEGDVTRTDRIAVELISPDDMPATIRITWPAAPTVVDPKRFPDTANTVATLFARAHVVLAALKAQGR